MPRTFAWHTTTSDVYHNNTGCNAGKAIREGGIREGTGGKALCERCRQLNRKERYGRDAHSGPDRSKS